MDFALTEAQEQLRTEARTYAREEIRPRAIELDRAGEYPAGVLADLGRRGWTGLTLPEASGGHGAGLVELALLIE
ncbi:MAG: acyl-CoA dehydrogenase family protein, partial [Haloferacaceae archaeon]